MKRQKAKKPKLSKLAKNKANVSSKYWLRRADSLWSKLVRESGCCSLCGSTVNKLDAHHILPKDIYPNYRHDTNCGIPLCKASCHKYGKTSAHRNGNWFAIWLRAQQQERWEWAYNHIMDYVDTPVKDYKAAYQRLQLVAESAKIKEGSENDIENTTIDSDNP